MERRVADRVVLEIVEVETLDRPVKIRADGECSHCGRLTHVLYFETESAMIRHFVRNVNSALCPSCFLETIPTLKETILETFKQEKE